MLAKLAVLNISLPLSLPFGVAGEAHSNNPRIRAWDARAMDPSAERQVGPVGTNRVFCPLYALSNQYVETRRVCGVRRGIA